MHIDAVIFDCDGTLVDSERLASAYSAPCRPPIPVHAGPPFRSMPAGVSEAG